VVTVAAAALATALAGRAFRFDRRQWRAAALGLGAVAIAAAAVALVINPSLWRDPLGFALRMLEHRGQQLELQMIFSDARSFIPLGEGLRRFGWRMLCWPDPIQRSVGLPLIALGIVFGALRFARGGPRPSAAWCALAAHGATWIAVTALTFRLDWARYLLPALPFATLLVVAAALALVEERWRIIRWPLLASAALALVLTMVVAPPADPATDRADYQWSLARLDRELTATASTSHLYRALLDRRAEVAERLEVRGDPAQALEAARSLLRGGDYRAAIAALDVLERADPTSPRVPEIRLKRAEAFAASGRIEAALEDLERVIATPGQEPKRAELLRFTAELRVELGDCPSAVADYRRAIGLGLSGPSLAAAREGIQRCNTAR
jgi:tetratricopeptide (TPR) repeat protein